jgi:hypothetical protein
MGIFRIWYYFTAMYPIYFLTRDRLEETLEYVNEQNIVPVLVECVGDDNMSMSVVIGCIQSCAVHGN